jgi:hypothetical protein
MMRIISGTSLLAEKTPWSLWGMWAAAAAVPTAFWESLTSVVVSLVGIALGSVVASVVWQLAGCLFDICVKGC